MDSSSNNPAWSVVYALPKTHGEIPRAECMDWFLPSRNVFRLSSEKFVPSFFLGNFLRRKLDSNKSARRIIEKAGHFEPRFLSIINAHAVHPAKLARFKDSYWQDGFLTITPDMAAEVISPNDLASELFEKVEEYLEVGIPLVWVIDPELRTVIIHRVDGTLTKLHDKDELTGENIIAGFRCRVAELFPDISSRR